MNEWVEIQDLFWFDNPDNPDEDIEVYTVHYERENEYRLMSQLNQILEDNPND